MKKILNYLKFNEEILLLNSYAYLAKVFISILTAYLIASHNAFLRKDMISILFGLALTLEQTNYTSLRNGYDQFASSVLGGLSAAIIVFFFGINLWTVALSVTFAVFVALKINWKSVSPVAVFTAIYMTQYVQTNSLGAPSMFLTFELRISALSFGISIALLYNFIFSLFFYDNFLVKRVYLVLDKLSENLSLLTSKIAQGDKDSFNSIKSKADELFGIMNWIFILFKDYTYDYKMKSKIFKVKDMTPERALNILLFSRNITHFISDLSITLSYAKLTEEEKEDILSRLNSALDRINQIKISIREVKPLKVAFSEYSFTYSDPSSQYCRLVSNLYEMEYNLSKIEKEIIDYVNKRLKKF
jgi:hypothetical protein